MACSVFLAVSLVVPAFADFDAQRAAMKDTMKKQPESAVMSLLEAGLAEGKAAVAIAEIRKWLAQNRPENNALLFHAGRAAELSGNWKDAVSLYQQYLEGAELSSAQADEAVFAVYVLLIERLKDEEGAYNFSRNQGDRLMVCPRAKQFDQWFLDRATDRNRKDGLAVANRLNACIEAGLPPELLVARYDNYFRWLLNLVDTHAKGSYDINKQTADAINELTQNMPFFDELRLRLDWAASVLYYTQSRLDGQDTPPPIAEATALLEKYPKYALWVQNGWAGGNGTDVYAHFVGDYKNYWAHELNAKITPVVKAASSLDPVRLAQLVASWGQDYYRRQGQEPSLGSLQCVSDFLVSRDPQDVNRYVSPLSKSWKEYSVDEARQLAPEIETNRHRDTSIIRAIAVGGKDFGKVMEALRGPESWRLRAVDLAGDSLTDALWRYCGRPGGNEKKNEERRKSRNIGEEQESVSITVDSPRKDRLREFKRYWDDYNAAMPTIPDVESKLRKVLRFTPEVVPVLLKGDKLHAQAMLRGVIKDNMNGPGEVWEEIKDGRSVNVWKYDPSIQNVARQHARNNLDELKKNHPRKYVMHPLEDAFRKAIKAGLKAGELASWKVIAWVNMQCPDKNKTQRELAGELRTSNIWDTLSFEARFAVREWFRKDGMSAAEAAWIDAANARLACEKLVGLSETSDVSATIAALQEAITGATKSPTRFYLAGMQNLGIVPLEVFRNDRVFALVLDVLEGLRYRSMDEHQKLGDRIYALIEKNMKDPVVIQRIGSYVAHYGARGSRGGKYKDLVPIIESLLETQPESASILAQNAVVIFSRARNIYRFKPKEHVQNLKTLAAKAAMRLGLFTIPVARNHPAYPVYQSQGEWLTGNEETAWTKLDDNWDQILPVHRKLSIDYLMWVLQRVIDQRDETRQEPLIKALLTWAGEKGSTLTPTEKAEIKIAYGDIAVQRGRLDDAHKLYTLVEKNEEFNDLLIQHEATLRKVRVERLAKNYDAALKTLKKLEMERVPQMWAPLRYARAEVYFDMKEYEDANDQIEKILARQPNHAEAKILQGKVQLKREKLMEATEIEVGTASSKKTLVPGEKLKVTLSDPTLAVSGAGVEVEVAVWTTSGDKERFFLRQFGDRKTKFRGTVDTGLGKPEVDDGTLQVIGDDKIYYGYSERFRQRLNDIPERRGGPITVSSDATLMASARKLLSPAEQRLADMERMLEIVDKRKTNIDALDQEERAALKAEAEAANRRRLLQARVKPGSPIHIRVVDPDRSRTDAIDELAVSVESSSGDSIGRVVLKETGPYTGWFTGDVPTARAQAMAFARNSEPGRNPNMVISPRDSYPAWRPESKKGLTPEFTVDLNDNVPLGELTITAKEQGAKLKKFALQTGMNREEMATVAVLHDKVGQITIEKPWHPSVTIMNDTDHHHRRDERSVYDLREIELQLERGWMAQQYPQGVAANVAGPADAMNPEIPAKVKWQRRNRHHNAHVIYRFRGYFYEPQKITRKFKVKLGKWQPPKVHESVSNPAQYMLAVDGRIVSEKKEKPPKAGAPIGLEGEIELRPGVHRFEIWSTGWDCRIGFGRDVKLLANLDDPEKMIECPKSFFDPDTFPKGVLAHRNEPVKISPNDTGTEFTVDFAPGSRARLLKIIFIDQESPVPMLNKLTLNQPDGEQVLPVEQDYAELNKNDTLEILTGDKVTVRYTDDRFVSKKKKTHERFLNVAYTNARVEFADIEPRFNEGRDEYMSYHETLLRFEYGKPLPVVIHDADMDMSAKPDSVKFTIENENGDNYQVTATEMTEKKEVSGTFRGFVTPVPTTKQPVKKNEIPVREGGTLTVTYRDVGNTSPGVPTDRNARIRHAEYQKPILKVAHATVSRFEPRPDSKWPTRELIRGFSPVNIRKEGRDRDREHGKSVSFGTGRIRPRWEIKNQLLAINNQPEGGFQAVHGRYLYLELDAPNLALRERSEVKVYAQTETGRKLAQKNTADNGPQTQEQNTGFDLSVPGTRVLNGSLVSRKLPHSANKTPEIATYVTRNRGSTKDDDQNRRFKLSVPLVADMLPDHGVLTHKEIEARRDRGMWQPVYGLVVQPDDRIHIGFRYKDGSGKERWLTTSAKVITHPVMDIMEEDYRAVKETAYVGETLHLCVVDLGGDKTDSNDMVRVRLKAESGAEYPVELREIDPHSGIFTGAYMLTYAKGNETPEEEYNVKTQGFPVTYGDEVTVVYKDASGTATPARHIDVREGADGTVAVFSKKYEDEDMAMRTQFALAEGYLEVAKHHRKLGEPEAAAREYARAKQLLSKAMNQFRDPETRAHAEYLLGNLTLQEADTTDNADLQQQRYRAALSRFMDVTGAYSETLYASKAQFKIATVYEKLDEPDIAAREYVKLAYKYPDSENLVVAMARLGAHFQRQAAAYEKKAKPLLAKAEDKDAQYDGKALKTMANQHYLKAANIFGRLQERFPSHKLAGKGGLFAGQSFMRAGEMQKAVAAFLRVVNEESYDGIKLRSPAMYWAGRCYQKLRQQMAAYSMYKRLTYDFPESKWAAYARGQLSQERMLKLETQLEIERLEEEGQ